MKKLRILSILALLLLFTLSMATNNKSVIASPLGNEDPKVTLCHATGSDSNPYVEITVAAAGAANGHYKHERDIIPSFTYNGTVYPGKNLDNGGQAILDNHCHAVTPTSTEVPPTATSTTVPPTATTVPPTSTSVPPTSTSVPPTNTPVPPTRVPTATPTPCISVNGDPDCGTPVVPTPTKTVVPPVFTAVPPTSTATPVKTPVVPVTATTVPLAAYTAVPTSTTVPATATSAPVQEATNVPATDVPATTVPVVQKSQKPTPAATITHQRPVGLLPKPLTRRAPVLGLPKPLYRSTPPFKQVVQTGGGGTAPRAPSVVTLPTTGGGATPNGNYPIGLLLGLLSTLSGISILTIRRLIG